MKFDKLKKAYTLFSPWQWACCVLALGIVIASIGYIVMKKTQKELPDSTAPRYIVAIDEADWECSIEDNGTVVNVSAKTLEDGLKDMGILITQDYYFTEVINYEKKGDFLWIFEANSSLMMSYEGKIGAGIDFSRIRIAFSEDGDKVTVYIPKPAIQYIEIDQGSLTVYSEKNKLGNKLGLADFNKAQSKLKEAALKKAKERGVLEKAETNAQVIIRNVITGMLGNDITICFESVK